MELKTTDDNKQQEKQDNVRKSRHVVKKMQNRKEKRRCLFLSVLF